MQKKKKGPSTNPYSLSDCHSSADPYRLSGCHSSAVPYRLHDCCLSPCEPRVDSDLSKNYSKYLKQKASNLETQSTPVRKGLVSFSCNCSLLYLPFVSWLPMNFKITTGVVARKSDLFLLSHISLTK